MRYFYHCKQCGENVILNRLVDERDKDVQCDCGKKMKRMMSNPSTATAIGCEMSAKRDGVGFMVGQGGEICIPKTRGQRTQRVRDALK